MDYNIILTDKGKAKIAAAIANSTTIELKKIAFGDGNGSVYMPTATATALKKKKYATDLNSVTIHPDNKNWIVCEGYIPTDEGDFWIREIGVFDEAGDLIAIGNYPETYKPLLTLGIGTDLVLRVVMEVSDASVVNLTIDPSLTMATQEWVKEEIKKNPSGTYIGMLSSSTRRDLPAGWIRLDGATYTQETFPQFYALLEGGKFPTCTAAQYSSYLSTQKGSCGFFVLDTSAKTFRVPTITDGAALTQALTTGELTKFYEGAIENIKGFFEAQTYPGCDNVDGQLFRKTYAGRANRNTNDTSYRFDFDASRVVATASETRTRQIRYPFVMCIAHAGEKEVSEVIWNG
ncbi:MAG: phage tail protein, partial [Campylobacteraceae bacterium]|nr:phage tail protein [Campylobacteraceae bacterium]